MGSPVLFNLAQHHLEPEHQRKVGARVTRLVQTQTEERRNSKGADMRRLTQAVLLFQVSGMHRAPAPHHRSGSTFLCRSDPDFTLAFLLTWMQPPRMLVVSFR